MGLETSELEAIDRLIGEVLANRYQIELRLGEGAMGAVYRAKHVKVGRAFAVKILHPRLLEDRKVLQRFEREAELAGRLRHPNVIGVVDVGETADGMRYMVMDFAEGADLATLLSEAPMPAERVINLTRQLLEGLYHAHEMGLIHRDFKPENVIVEKDTHGKELPRIVDFGIAILREGGDSPAAPGRLTTNGLVLGTPHYMAPEQAVADPIDHRIDLFALGIIVYEMLCGKLPFDGTGAEVARANLLLDPPRISERVPYLQVDPLLEAFARRMMAKKRDMRPPTAKAAREILDLIEKDREAAAAALGVPMDAARPPMETQDSTPIPRHNGDYPGTFPPPLREDQTTPRQAPPLGAKLAVPRRGEAALETQLTEPIGGPRKRWPLVVAALVGVAGLATAAAVMLGGHHKDTAPNQQAVAMDTSPTGSAAAAAQPSVAPIETKPADTNPAAGSAAVETTDTNPAAGSAAVETTDTNPAAGSAAGETKPVETKAHLTTRPKQPKHVETKHVETKPVDTKPVETKPVETKPVETVKVTPPVDTKPKSVDTGALVAQYKSVGAELKALETAKGADAVSDLQSRYRMIRITDAMATQDKRDAAAALLSKLHADIAGRR